jgi:hypothetical protein
MHITSLSKVTRAQVDQAIREGKKITRIIHFKGTDQEYCESLKSFLDPNFPDEYDFEDLEAQQNYRAATMAGVQYF